MAPESGVHRTKSHSGEWGVHAFSFPRRLGGARGKIRSGRYLELRLLVSGYERGLVCHPAALSSCRLVILSEAKDLSARRQIPHLAQDDKYLSLKYKT
jgi:hypothetical protein